MPLVCEHCQKPTRRVIQQTKGPLWCPHCDRDRRLSEKFDSSSFVVRDEYPQSITLENYGAQPVTFNSESERLTYMRAHDLEHKERWCPFPGTDRDPAGVQNPEGYVDEVTLQNRAALFLRAHTAPAPSIPMEVFKGTISGADALAVATGTDPIRQSRVHRRTAEQTHGK